MNKQPITINFAQGLDTKTDPRQITVGKFTSLQNTVFTKAGLLQKRNGFPAITQLNNDASYLTTLNGNLTAIGSTVSAYSSSLDNWITKGQLQPCGLSVLSLIKNNLSQIQADAAISNGMVLTVYTSVNNGSNAYFYAVADEVTGQNIVEPTAIAPISGGTISGSSRAFIVGNYFVIVSQVIVSSTTSLQYISLPINNPVNLTTNVANASAPQKVTTEVYSPITSNPGWDGAVSNNTLVVAYNSTTTAQGVHVASLNQAQIAANSSSSTIHQFNNAAYIGAIVSICVDTTQVNHVFYVTFWNNSTLNAYTLAFTIGFGTITQQFAPRQIVTSAVVANIASAAQNNSCMIFYEIPVTYPYDSGIQTSVTNAIPVSSTGTVGGTYNAIRSVGLASKAFIVNGTVYFLAAYQSPFQPTYFLMNGSLTTQGSPVIVAKLAYENGGGYVTTGLPNVTVTGNIAQISYLYKDLIEALNTLDNPQQTTAGGIYAQTGVNLASFTLGTESIDTAEIANTLHLSGGFLGMYDGYLPVEHNFFLWPDSIEVTTNASAVTPTGTVTSGSPIVTAVSSMVGIGLGASVTGTGISASTTVIAIGTNSFTMSTNATGSHTAETITVTGNVASSGASPYFYQVIYEWTDNNGLVHRSAPSIPVTIATTGSTSTNTVNIPTLRLTQKTANPVKITIYRWSTANQIYYQITSITAPLLNSTSTDSVVWYDSQPDANIIGSIIYTNGGVIENVNAPASNGILTLFDTRLWLVDAEDPNLLWYSKQVIEQTPVEMSDLFTIYIAPNTGTTESTGPITAIFPMDDKLIILKANSIFYLNGTGPDNTGTNNQYSQPIFITSTVGCTNQQSIVLMPDGLMFQSDKGIWLLSRGLGTTYIGAPAEGFTQGTLVTSANAIPETNQVRFTLSSGFWVMYDYYYQQWGDFVRIPAISSTIYQGAHTYLSSSGLIAQEDPDTYLDNGNPTLIQFSTGPIWLAGITGFQRAIELIILGTYLSPHKLLVTIEFDFGKFIEQHTITPTNATGVYGSDSLYGQTSPYGGMGDVEEWRIQFDTQQCQSIQVSLQELYDPSIGEAAGAGFTLSSMTVLVGVKKNIRPFAASKTVGSYGQ